MYKHTLEYKKTYKEITELLASKYGKPNNQNRCTIKGWCMSTSICFKTLWRHSGKGVLIFTGRSIMRKHIKVDVLWYLGTSKKSELAEKNDMQESTVE